MATLQADITTALVLHCLSDLSLVLCLVSQADLICVVCKQVRHHAAVDVHGDVSTVTGLLGVATLWLFRS